ncbi:hypothetical protein N431DRAFT_164372 [Stipitochalara longipes BDJ]|nr:hypothetical protein N431DRAFT_164372 [Stipitochalara longipes BDJ]
MEVKALYRGRGVSKSGIWSCESSCDHFYSINLCDQNPCVIDGRCRWENLEDITPKSQINTPPRALHLAMPSYLPIQIS